MAAPAWTNNPVDPEDTGNFQRPDLRVVTPTLSTGEYPTLVNTPPPAPPRVVTARAPVLEAPPLPNPPMATAMGPRHARPDPMPPQATTLFDSVSESLELTALALDFSERAAGPQLRPELQQLRVAIGHLLQALDATTEGVVAMFDRR